MARKRKYHRSPSGELLPTQEPEPEPSKPDKETRSSERRAETERRGKNLDKEAAKDMEVEEIGSAKRNRKENRGLSALQIHELSLRAAGEDLDPVTPFLVGDVEPRGACWDFGWLAALLPLPLLVDHVQVGVVDLEEERKEERSTRPRTMSERLNENDDELPPGRYLLNAICGGTSLREATVRVSSLQIRTVLV